MSTLREAVEEMLKIGTPRLLRWAALSARAARIRRWKLPRCNHKMDVEPAEMLCNRVVGHPGMHCGSKEACEFHDGAHNDLCRCETPSFPTSEDWVYGRCACGGFPLVPNQPPGDA